jgi:hypothetical protein
VWTQQHDSAATKEFGKVYRLHCNGRGVLAREIRRSSVPANDCVRQQQFPTSSRNCPLWRPSLTVCRYSIAILCTYGLLACATQFGWIPDHRYGGSPPKRFRRLMGDDRWHSGGWFIIICVAVPIESDRFEAHFSGSFNNLNLVHTLPIHEA